MSEDNSQLDLTPFAEPLWLRSGVKIHYYNESHHRFQKAVRAYVENELMPFVGEWEEAKLVPQDVYKRLIAKGPPLPLEYLPKGTKLIGNLDPADYDGFHDFIWNDEMGRLASNGVMSALTSGFQIGLPPLVHYASPELQQKLVPSILSGDKRICLAITGPEAGSDVAGIDCTAQKTEDGKHYIVNGQKKWITNGIWSDYVTAAVRTGGKGRAGLSMLIIPTDLPGVDRRRMNTGGAWSSGTTFFEFEDVKVPVEYLIGKEGEGMKYVTRNFNHERMYMAMKSNRWARVAISDAFGYACKRKAFGKPLIDQPVVRHRLAQGARLVEAQHAWLETIVHVLSNMTKAVGDDEMSGLTALAKAQGGIIMAECASIAVLILGGNGYTRGGNGEKIERIYRDVNGIRLPGGSEDVLLDLGVRQQLKSARKHGAKL